MPEALEAGTLNTPGILSLGAGIDFINEIGIDKIKRHEDKLTKIGQEINITHLSASYG